MIIYLAYTNNPLASNVDYDANFNTTYASGSIVGKQQSFEPLKWKPAISQTIKEEGRLSNGTKFSHVLFKYDKYEYTIKSSDLTDDYFDFNSVYDFLVNFWNAQFKYLNFGGTSHYIQIITEGEDFPLSFIDDVIYFPEISLKFTTANGAI